MIVMHPNTLKYLKKLDPHTSPLNIFGDYYMGERILESEMCPEFTPRIPLLLPDLLISDDVREKVNATLLKFGSVRCMYRMPG